jgi:hypothetical protein
VSLLKNHMMPGSFHVNLWIVFSCPNTITYPILWLQFYLKCSRRSKLATLNRER